MTRSRIQDKFIVRACYRTKFELRQAKDKDKYHRVEGRVVPFNKPTQIFRDLYEEFAPGSFTRTLKEEDQDAALLIEHRGLAIARCSNNTVTFSESDEGLEFEAKLDRNDPDVQALVPKLDSGVISEMSVGFFPIEYSIREEEDYDTIIVRDAELVEGSFVTFPQYDGTSAELRSRLLTIQDNKKLNLRVPNPRVDRIKEAEARLAEFKTRYIPHGRI